MASNLDQMVDQWQETFLLSLLANCNPIGVLPIKLASNNLEAARVEAQEKLTSALRTELETLMQVTCPEYFANWNWQVVWGPQVYVPGPRTVDLSKDEINFTAANAMYVAFNGQRYVIAIAATNSASYYDWLIEDVDLVPGINWRDAMKSFAQNNSGNPPQNILEKAEQMAETALESVVEDVLHPFQKPATITNGSFVGLTHLFAMIDDNTQTSLLQFLNKKCNSTSQITVTGHSLGGALSPLMGLALVDTENPLLDFSPQVNVYATAGATPGNAALQAQYFQKLPASMGAEVWQVWNAVISNKFDLVPSAWAKESLNNWANYLLKSDEYHGLKNDIEINAARLALEAIAAKFEDVNGNLSHLSTSNVTGVLNPDVKPEDGVYWQMTVQPPSKHEPRLLTLPQAAAITKSGAQITNQSPLSFGAQVHNQHVMAYEQMILPGLRLPSLSSKKEI